MLSKEEKNILLNNLNQSSLDNFTINYIIDYANVSTSIFNIDHTILINNLSNNIKKDIIFSKRFGKFSNMLGKYDFKSKQIIISNQIKNKQHLISLIFHELDHAANFQMINIDDKSKYLNSYIKRLSIEHPLLFRFHFIRNLFAKKFLKSYSFSSGFNNTAIGKMLGINLNLFKEGITTYKQSKYEDYLNLTDKLTCQNINYKNAQNVAQLLEKIKLCN